MSNISFSNKYSSEVITLGFDFSDRLDSSSSEIISTATFSIQDTSNLNSNVSNILIGSPIIVGGIVKTMVQGGLSGHTYTLEATVNTTGGRTLIGSGNISIN
jgi:hypothetical protein